MKLQDNVKIVIWDLDDTFWRGTLSEGEVEKIPSNIDIVKTLIDRGIMCSIVSKNDHKKAIKVLEEWDVAKYFIFPYISWFPKGKQVNSLLKECSLRPQNTLFLDDNISNLREVEYYNPGIMTALPQELEDDFLCLPQLKGKDDREHTRLKEYRVLEERSSAKASYSSNIDFLRSSNIRIRIIYGCEEHIDRITELIQRSNQLNYTKNRLSSENVSLLLKNPEYKCGCIEVKDHFGEYGITGFYALKEDRLDHFCFSCRTIGFGIENYIYRKLNYPKIDVVGDVSVELTRMYAESIDWISEDEVLEDRDIALQKKDNDDHKHKKSILMVAGCDLEQACSYLESKYEIVKEFNTVINGREIRTSDTAQLLNSVDLDDKVKDELCNKIPFYHSSVTFATKIFSGEFDTIILSVVDDYIRGIWANKKSGYYVGLGGYFDQEKFIERYTDEELSYLRQNFEYIGQEPVEIFKSNLIRIIELIGNYIHIVLINGIDIDVSDWIGEERIIRNRDMNAIVDEIVDSYDNIDLLDMRRIVTSREMLTGCDNRHFTRSVYYEMAKELVLICGSEELKVNAYKPQIIKNLITKIKKLVFRKSL